MKRIFGKIWAGLTAFLSWLVSSFTAIFRGRTIKELPETEPAANNALTRKTVDDFPFLPPEQARDVWLDRVNFLALHRYERRYKLAVALSITVSEEVFSGLQVTVFPQDQFGIRCIADQVEAHGQTYILRLSPASEWDSHSREKRITWKNHRAQNVARVSLETEDKTRDFLPGKDTSTFIPEKKEVAA